MAATQSHRRLVTVADADPATDVERRGRMSPAARISEHLEQSVERRDPRRRLHDLRAEVHRERIEHEGACLVEHGVGVGQLVDRDPELEAALPRADVGMRLGGDVGVDADPDRHPRALGLREHGEPTQLRHRLDIDVAHARGDGGLQLVIGLPDPAEDDPLGGEPGGERAQQLAARDDIGPRPAVREQPQHREIAVRLHGVADPVRQRAEGRVETGEALADHRGVVHVRGRPHGLGHDAERHLPHQEVARRTHREPGVGEERRQYARAHTATTVAGFPVQMQVVGRSAERNSSIGRQRMVAFVCALISASTAGSPQNPA